MIQLPEDIEAEKALLSTLCAPGADATAAEMVSQLQEADFTHPNHRRVYPATLTTKGRRVLAACDAAVDEMEEEMLGELNPEQRATLLEWLKSCVRGLRAGFPQG